jgi:hypothetical protein
LKCEKDSNCALALNKQPVPVKHTSSTVGYSLALIDDNAQTLTLYDSSTGKVREASTSLS